MPKPGLLGGDGEKHGGASSEESRLIQALFEHRHRLIQKRKYQPLEISQEAQSDIKLSNAVGFVDLGLRDFFGNASLEELLDGELDLEDPKTQAQFKALCTVLDGIVNTDQLDNVELKKARQHQHLQETSSYKNLSAVEHVLRTSNWAFHLVAGQGHNLFRLVSEPVAVHAMTVIGKVNDFFYGLSRPTLTDIPPPQLIAAQIDSSDGSDAQHWHIPALKALFALLPQKELGENSHSAEEKSPKRLDFRSELDFRLKEHSSPEENRTQPPSLREDGHEHTVLVKLLDCDAAKSHATGSTSALDIFLSTCNASSTCEESSKWQECQCDSHSTINGQWWRSIENLCQEIKDVERMGCRLCLAANDEKIFALSMGSNAPHINWRKSYKGYQPTKTLRSLLPSGDPQTTPNACSTPTFDLKQRRTLAAKLASSLSVFLGHRHTLKSWDAEHIYFLLASNDGHLQEHPFALYVADDNDADIEALKNSDFNKPIPIFVSLARLLMEIEDDVCLKSISPKELQRKVVSGINQRFTPKGGHEGDGEIGQTKDVSRVEYLQAVNFLLTLDILYRQQTPERKARLNNDPIEIVKSIIRTHVADALARTIPRNVRPTGYWSREPLSSPARQSPSIILFDDHDNAGDATTAKEFYDRLQTFQDACEAREKQLEASKKPLRSGRRVRIAILDTGINRAHMGIDAGFEMKRLDEKRCYSWVDDTTNFHDNHGHGTNVTALVLRVAPEADIYVAKVFSGGEVQDDEVDNVAKAIHHAVNAWDVDIISMSFGLKSFDHVNQKLRQPYINIAKEIQNSKNKILFAAAANAGDNTGRAFPASCEEVICVHASNGKGKDGGISPSAKGKEDNFMTLGIAVECYNLNDPKCPKKEYKSGTSYATPIAAALAAQVLYVTERLMDVREPSLECLRTRKGMRKMFELMCEPTGSSGYRYLAPWVKCWPEGWHRNDDKITLVESTIHSTEGLQYSTNEQKTDTERLDV